PISEIHDATLPASEIQELFPIGIKKRVVGHADQAFVVAEAIAADRLKLIDEQSGPIRLAGAVLRFPLQNKQGGFDTKTPAFILGLPDDKSLESVKIMQQAGEAGRQ